MRPAFFPWFPRTSCDSTYHTEALLGGGNVDDGAVQLLDLDTEFLDGDVEAFHGLEVASRLEGHLFQLLRHLIALLLELALLLLNPGERELVVRMGKQR